MKKFFLALVTIFIFSSCAWADYSSAKDKQHSLSVSANTAKTYNNITVTKKGGPSVQSSDYDLDGRNSAVFASKGARLTIKGSSTITTTNANHSHGVYVDNSANKNTRINLSETTININSDYSAGVMAVEGGTISADKIKVTTSGDYSPAVCVGVSEGTVLISGGTFTTKGPYSPVLLLSSDAEVTISNATLKASHVSSDLISLVNTSDSTLNISKMTLSGDISVEKDSELTLNLKNKSTFNGKINTSGDVNITVENGSTWNLTGNSYVKTLENYGQIISNDFSIFVDGSTEGEEIINYEEYSAPSITTSSLKAGAVDIPYSSALKATGTEPFIWSVSKGSLPEGLDLDEDDGTISGKPTTQKKYSFTITASNDYGASSKSYTMTINAAPTAPTITTTALTNAVANKSYSFTLKATGTAPIVWSSDNLPDELNLTKAGVLSGKLTEVRTHSINFTASNDANFDTKTLTLKVVESKPTIVTTKLASGDVAKDYSSKIEITSTNPAVTITGLPKGIISSDLEDGVINLSGTPTESGTFTVRITAKNEAGSTSKSLQMIIYAAPVIKTTSTDVTVNSNFSLTLKADGTTPITWKLKDNQSGITLSSSGLLKGKVTQKDTYTFNVIATNSIGSSDIDFELRAKNAKPTLTGTVKQGTVDGEYLATFTAKGDGDIEITCSESDELESIGLEFEMSGDKAAKLTGTPTQAYNKKISVTASNDGGSVTKTFNLVIKAVKPTIVTKALEAGIINQTYEETEIEVTGTRTITTTVTGLPEELKFNDGKISGTPTKFGNFTVKITAKNYVGNATKSLKLNVYSPPTINNSITLPAATIGKSYSKKFTATGTTPLKWKISDGELPAGMKINATGGTLNGTPKEFGVFNFTVFVSNDYGEDTFVVSDFKVNSVPPKITTSSLKTGTQGKDYKVTMKASGTAPITWEASNLPDGLEIDEETGIISGNPNEFGSFTVSITATNANDESVSKNFKMTVAKSKTALTSTSKSTPNELKIHSELEDEIEIELETVEEFENYETNYMAVPENQNQVKKALSAKNKIPEGYIKIAELGIISSDKDGLYDFEVELDEQAQEGAELLWLAFPKDVEHSEDDEICEFYDSEGEEINSVPKDKIINISVWLEEGIIYEPVIAAKTENFQ